MSALFDEAEERKFLFTKKVVCPNCEWKFNDIRVLNSKLRRKEPDADLRPRFQNIDPLKYIVTACPKCGFSASAKNFKKLTELQKKLLMEKVSSKFIARRNLEEGQVINYETALEQYQLALLSAVAVELPMSEQAYLCLQTSWLIRGWLEEDAAEEQGMLGEAAKQQLQKKEKLFYRQAYDGLAQAVLQEDFPICGMDQSTFYYLLGTLSYGNGEYDSALRYCGAVVQDREVSAKLKDKALMLKDDVAAAKKKAEAASKGAAK